MTISEFISIEAFCEEYKYKARSVKSMISTGVLPEFTYKGNLRGFIKNKQFNIALEEINKRKKIQSEKRAEGMNKARAIHQARLAEIKAEKSKVSQFLNTKHA